MKLNEFKIEPQNRRISNRRISRVGAASLSLFENRSFDPEALDGQNALLRRSTFIIRYSLFQSFFIDQAGRYAARGWADVRNLTPDAWPINMPDGSKLDLTVFKENQYG